MSSFAISSRMSVLLLLGLSFTDESPLGVSDSYASTLSLIDSRLVCCGATVASSKVKSISSHTLTLPVLYQEAAQRWSVHLTTMHKLTRLNLK